MRALCVRIGAGSRLVCTVVVDRVCSALQTIAETICDATQTITQTVCDATQTISRTVCTATQTVTRTICTATSWIPFIGSLICAASKIVSDVICVATQVITEVICIATRVVSTIVCVASRIVLRTICIAWRAVMSIVCILVEFVGRIVCLFTRCGPFFWLSTNEVSSLRSECIYGWTAAFRITEEDRECTVRVVLRIRLVPDPDVSAADIAAVQARWEPAIEAAWSNQFPLVLQGGECRCRQYSLSVDVQWVQTGQHHSVRVRSGSGRANMGTWFVNSTGGTAAHESGHMFGNADEYTDSSCPLRTVTSDGSIMQNSQTGRVKRRHYQGFADWLSARTCCTYGVGGSD